MYQIFASAFTDSNSAAENQATLALAACTVELNLGVRPLLAAGAYQGKPEQSLIFCVEKQSDVHYAARLFCSTFQQECILAVNADSEAYLLDANGTFTAIGKLVCNKVGAFPTDFDGDYTYDGRNIYTVE